MVSDFGTSPQGNNSLLCVVVCVVWVYVMASNLLPLLPITYFDSRIESLERQKTRTDCDSILPKVLDVTDENVCVCFVAMQLYAFYYISKPIICMYIY